MTFKDSGLYDKLKDGAIASVIDTFDKNVSKEESLERRRQALLADLFITGTNAVTETGKLINLDMIGNRVGAITFGPKHVVIMVGRNKIVGDIEDGMIRTTFGGGRLGHGRTAEEKPTAEGTHNEKHILIRHNVILY